MKQDQLKIPANKPVISIVFPCFCPSEKQWNRLFEFIHKIKSAITIQLEFIVVDDGSSYWVEPEKLKELCKIVRLAENLGKGAALKEALKLVSTSSQVFSFIDFDLPYSSDDLLKTISPVFLNHVDIAVGNRKSWWINSKVHQGSRGLTHRLFRLISRFFLGDACDSQCGVKSFKTSIAKSIASCSKLNGFLFDLEWLYIAQTHLIQIQQVPVTILDEHRATGLSHFLKLREIKDYVIFLLNVSRKQYLSHELIELKLKALESQVKLLKSLPSGTFPLESS